ncbi:MAG TPA: DUF3786 domain-containing protein [Syntrophaceticus sp.]|nr:DUF3786 domain-containing protein [Syntrophaceticus sp.]
MFSETYREAKEQFARGNPKTMAELSCAEYDPEKKEFQLTYFNKLYRISYPEGIIDCPQDLTALPLEEQALILQYLTQATGVKLSGKWISYAELPYGMLHYRPFQTEAVVPLAETFGGQPGKLLQLARALGGLEIGIGDVGVMIPVFPRLPVAVILWTADEEFPARANMVFDSSAPAYLTTASLYVLGAVVTRRLKKMVR